VADALLDTGLFLDYLAGMPEAYVVVQQLLEGSLRGSVSALSLLELGMVEEVPAEAHGAMEQVLERLEVAPVDGPAAQQAAAWLRGLPLEERRKEAPFALIAAVAAQRGEPILTRVPERYARFGVSTRAY
jgi:predicted nucleic acid-binding protein